MHKIHTSSFLLLLLLFFFLAATLLLTVAGIASMKQEWLPMIRKIMKQKARTHQVLRGIPLGHVLLFIMFFLMYSFHYFLVIRYDEDITSSATTIGVSSTTRSISSSGAQYQRFTSTSSSISSSSSGIHSDEKIATGMLMSPQGQDIHTGDWHGGVEEKIMGAKQQLRGTNSTRPGGTASSTNNHHRIPQHIIFMDGAPDFFQMENLRQQNSVKTITAYLNFWQQEAKSQNLARQESTALQQQLLHEFLEVPNEKHNRPSNKTEFQEHQNQHHQSPRTFAQLPPGVSYLNDNDCLKIIQRVEPRLAFPFQREPMGKYRGDICRIAALYEAGGYYFDTDMEVIQPLSIPPHITFVTVRCPYSQSCFFQSFIAVAPQHPLLKINLNLLVNYYQAGNQTLGTQWDKFHELLGPNSLYLSYKNFMAEFGTEEYLMEQWPVDTMLEESHLSHTQYHHIPYRGQNFNCNYIVHNATQNEVYFYSRILGSSAECPLTESTARSDPIYEDYESPY